MSEEACGLPATKMVFWPGKEPMQMCEYHARGCRAIANAMGFYLQINDLTGDAATCVSLDSRPLPPVEKR